MAREMWGFDEYIAAGETGALNAIGLPWVVSTSMRRVTGYTDSGGAGGLNAIGGNGVSSAQQNTSPTFYGGSGGRTLTHFHAKYRMKLEEIINGNNAVRFEWYDNAGVNNEMGSVRVDGDTNLMELYTSTGTLVATSVDSLTQGVWHVIEIEVLIKDSGGFIKVWVNDSTLDKKTATPFLEFSGDTKPGTATGCVQCGVLIGRFAEWDDFALNSVTLAYDGGTGTAPTAGQTVTDGTSGATAVITAVEGDATSGILVLQEWDGTAFGNNNTITTATLTALVNAPTSDYVNGFEPNSGALGPTMVVNLNWSGNGTTSQLTGSDADSVDNYLHTDELMGEDANYVEATSTGLFDTYAADDLPTGTDTVRCLQQWALAHSDLLGIDDMQFATRFGGTDRFSGNKALPSSSGFLQETLDTHPDGTTGAMTPAVINAGEFGWKMV